jgi:hypothetical protein
MSSRGKRVCHSGKEMYQVWWALSGRLSFGEVGVRRQGQNEIREGRTVKPSGIRAVRGRTDACSGQDRAIP